MLLQGSFAIESVDDNSLWKSVVIMKMSTLMYREPGSNLRRKNPFFAPHIMVFDMKQDARRKARLVIGRHVLDVDEMDTYSSIMKTISECLPMIIARISVNQ